MKIRDRKLTAKELNVIRGKALVGAASKVEVMSLFHYIDFLEERLDDADADDCFGTQGWRYAFGLELNR